MNQATLQQKLKALAAFPGSDPQVIEKLGRILGNLEDWDLFRINPLDFAEKHGFDQAIIADYFVRGAKVGLFDFEWNMICPMCGGVVHSHSAIHEVEADHFHCTACNIDVSSELDDQVEIAFSLNPGIAPLDLDPYRDYNAYTRYYISQNFAWPAEAAAYMQHEALRSFTVLEPDGEARVHFEAQPGEAYQLLSREHHAVFMLRFEDKMSDTPQVVDLDLLKTGFTSHSVALPAGRVTLHLHSHLSTRAGLALLRHDEAMMQQMMQEAPPTVAPFFTGKMLINNQTFRDLFRTQNLPYDLNLKVGSVTILFTDLKGSTELYDDTGDLTAYELVQKHFELLKASAQAQTGAVVKTIGDAVMASFSTPLAAVRAAVDMVAKVEQLNREHQIAGHPLGLKVGLHVGPALAVNANETLDYFGQTVNIAARVQGLAYAGEIWITQPVYETPGVPDFLKDHGYAIEKQTAMLKGVREKATVYKCVAH